MRDTWYERATCNDPALGDARQRIAIFYPDFMARPAVARAKAICASCPVKLECRTEAVVCGDSFGVQGGMTALERDRWAESIVASKTMQQVS